MPPYPNKLKLYRLKRNLTQQQVTALLGQKSTSRLSTWEAGISLPNVINLLALCDIYKVAPKTLYRPYKKTTKKKPVQHSKEIHPHHNPDPEYPGDDAGDDELLEYLAKILVDIARSQ